MKIKAGVKVQTGKTEHPDMSYEQIKEMVKQLNEQARKGLKR